jgi:hypothetical protein
VVVPAGSIAYPTADVLLLALLARLLISAGVHNTAFHLLASSLVIMLIGDVGFAVLAEVDAFTNSTVIKSPGCSLPCCSAPRRCTLHGQPVRAGNRAVAPAHP